jgi:hypothetical protein
MSHRSAVSFFTLLAALVFGSCSTVTDVLPDAGCGTKKPVSLTKILTPTDQSFFLASDSGSLSTSCLAHFMIEFGYNNTQLQNSAIGFNLNTVSYDTSAWRRMPLKGLSTRQIMFVDGGWVFNSGWTVGEKDRAGAGLIARDLYIDYYDHGSHSGQAASGLGVYSVVTQLLSSITSPDSSMFVQVTIEYYDGKTTK